MADVINTLDFNTLPVANPATPPAGYTKPTGSDDASIANTTPKTFTLASGSINSIWYDNTNLTGDDIASEVEVEATSGFRGGACLVDDTGTGYVATQNDTEISVYLVLNGQLSVQLGIDIVNPFVAGLRLKLQRTPSTGDMTIWVDDVQVGEGNNYQSLTYDPRFAGVLSRGAFAGKLTSIYKTESGIISSGLTDIGLTSPGLTAVGL